MRKFYNWLFNKSKSDVNEVKQLLHIKPYIHEEPITAQTYPKWFLTNREANLLILNKYGFGQSSSEFHDKIDRI
jgi:hypothetical protein